MTNEPKDNPDKVGYEKAKKILIEDYIGNKLCDDNGDGCEDCMEGVCKEQVYQHLIRLEALAIAEGKRRGYEKVDYKVPFHEGRLVGYQEGLTALNSLSGVRYKQGRQQALKEVEEFLNEEISECERGMADIKYEKTYRKVLSAIDQLRNKGV